MKRCAPTFATMKMQIEPPMMTVCSLLQSSILNQSIVPCPLLTIAFWHAYRFLRRQVWWAGIPNSWRISQFIVIHRVKDFSIVNEEEVDAFLEFSCFFYDGSNWISGSSAFSKVSLYIWKFLVLIHWSLAWKILSMTLLSCKIGTIVG